MPKRSKVLWCGYDAMNGILRKCHKSEHVFDLIDIIKVLASPLARDDLGPCLRVMSLPTPHLLIEQPLMQFLFELHLPLIVALAVLQSVLRVDLNGVLILFGLHRNDIVVLLLLLIHLLVRNELVQ